MTEQDMPKLTALMHSERIYLKTVESHVDGIPNWYELYLGRLLLVKIRQWGFVYGVPKWALYSFDPDSHRIDTCDFPTPTAALNWFYQNHIKEPKDGTPPSQLPPG